MKDSHENVCYDGYRTIASSQVALHSFSILQVEGGDPQEGAECQGYGTRQGCGLLACPSLALSFGLGFCSCLPTKHATTA